MKIGVLSDTHIPFRARHIPAQVFEALDGVDLILHAGDVCEISVLDDLQAIAPVRAVYGNVDPPELVRRLPQRELVDAAGLRIGLIHGHGPGRAATPQRALRAFPDAHCVVFGHTHQPHNQRHGEVLLFNPGSSTDKRRMPRPSFGMLFINGTDIRGEITFL